MNITPINAVSFKGRWEIRKTKANRPEIGRWCFNRFHVYHPNPNEPEIDIAIKLERMAKKFSGKKRITKAKLAKGVNLYHINSVKLGKPWISGKETAELTKEQKALRKVLAQTKVLSKIAADKLAEVGKKLALKPPKPKRKRTEILM